MTLAMHISNRTPFEEVQDDVESLYAEAQNWLDGEGVTGPKEADGISRLMDMLRKAKTAADASRKAEAKPFDDGKAEVQARYNPLLKRCDTAIETCKAALHPYLQKLEDEKRAEQAKAAAAAEAARVAAAEAMAATRMDDLAGREKAEALVEQAKAADLASRRADNDRAQAKGGTRATTLRSTWVPELVNAKDAAAHFWKLNPGAFDALLIQLATVEVREGKRSIPGFNITEHKAVV